MNFHANPNLKTQLTYEHSSFRNCSAKLATFGFSYNHKLLAFLPSVCLRLPTISNVGCQESEV